MLWDVSNPQEPGMEAVTVSIAEDPAAGKCFSDIRAMAESLCDRVESAARKGESLRDLESEVL